jgi:polysaccharide deacetylase 2 family uncharacterized protein YibQ
MAHSGWRRLGLFWVVVIVVLGVGAVTLQFLGPPSRTDGGRASALAPAPSSSGAPASPTSSGQAPPDGAGSQPQGSRTQGAATQVTGAMPAAFLPSPGRDSPGPIAGPDPALLEPAKSGGGAVLPRMDMSGRGPMQAYAGGFDRTTRRPRVGLVLAGIGMNEADSLEAIRNLPGGVTLAVSPYAQRLSWQLEAARIGGHEYLLSLPLEPQGFPQNDAGDHALMTGGDPAQNVARLDWALSRLAGYAGVTNALGVLRGERFSAASDLMAPVLDELMHRGLFFVEARPGVAPWLGIWSADVDLIVDEPPDRASIDAKLAQLEALARDRGAALGLAGVPRPVTVDRLVAWTNSLQAKGLVLAPTSALVQWHPKQTPTTASARAPTATAGARP